MDLSNPKISVIVPAAFVSRKTAIEWAAAGMRRGRDSEWLAALQAAVQPHAEQLRQWFDGGIHLKLTVAILGVGNSIRLLDIHDALAQIADQLTNVVRPREKGRAIPQTDDRHFWHVVALKEIDAAPRVEVQIEPL